MDTVLAECIDADLTDFHVAAKNSEVKPVLVRIMRGVNLNAKSCFGRTAQHFAAMSIRKNEFSARIYQIILLEAGYYGRL